MSVYALHDPRTGACRYVGRSRTPRARLRNHITNAHSAQLRAWVADLQAAGLEPELRMLDGGTEREWIVRLSPDLNVGSGSGDESTSAREDIAVSMRFPGSLHAEATAAAKADDRTLNSLVVRAVRVYVEAEKGKRKPGR